MNKTKKRLLTIIIIIIILFGLFNAAFFLRRYLYFDKYNTKMDKYKSDLGYKVLDNGDHIGFSETGYLSIDGGNYFLSTKRKKDSTVYFEIVAWPRIFNHEYMVNLYTLNPQTHKTETSFSYRMNKNYKITSSITPEQEKIINDNNDLITEKIKIVNNFFGLD